MKHKIWRVSIAIVFALGIVSGLVMATATAFASNERGQNPAPPSNAWYDCVYWVRHGDTLFSIGMRYGVSPYYLAQINGLWNPNYIYAGMKLQVPCNGRQPWNPKPKHPEKPVTPCQPAVKYLVKPGDNLFRIALNHGTTVNAIRDANNLWGRVLRPGMTLIIPCPGTTNYGATPLPPADSVPPAQGQTPIPPAGGETPGAPPPASPPALAPEPSAQVVIGAGVDPNSVTIKMGQSVVWVNNSGGTITILSGFPGQENNLFNSGPIPNGGTWVHLFDTIGNYSYFVSENPTMVGQVNVTQ